ncbi:MAG: NAD(P)H-dependent oxidoreductase [Eubacteriales bacterium]|nr:NAD(P)H-dependent oxidoreductase [Eubacteriales bacterium]
MINILSFAGSLRGGQSRTARFSKMVTDRLCAIAASEGVPVNCETITGAEYRAAFCLGCESCFQKGTCPLDSTDDLGELKSKILKSDILLFCSPVYCCSMSGLTKTVLDRLSYWTHRFELAGKPAAVLVTTSAGYGQETADTIREAVSAMGASIAYAGYAVRHIGTPNLNIEEEIGPEAERIAGKLWDCRRDPAKYIHPRQEYQFRYFKKKALQTKTMCELLEKGIPCETSVIYERGMFDYASYADYVRQLTQKQRGS